MSGGDPGWDDPLAGWRFDLPEDRIARYPAARRDGSRLLRLGAQGPPTGHAFSDLPDLLSPGDLLVLNDTRVVPARLHARRATGGRVEVLLVDVAEGVRAKDGLVGALLRPARRLREGEHLTVADGHTVEVVTRPDADGVAQVRLHPSLEAVTARHGALPLPPYLGRAAEPVDDERYQTVYARVAGSSAAPTAGLHFTPAVFDALEARGVARAHVTLHVGLGTFRPLRPEDLARGTLHAEPWSVPPETVAAVARARARGGRVIAVGTTSARVLESAADPEGRLVAGEGITTLFLKPPDPLRIVDGLITNFHLPGSSLLMLVACLVGRERLLDAYGHAVDAGYRFYSYGDAMLVLPTPR